MTKNKNKSNTKLKALGKGGRELKPKETRYDEKGNWINTNNEDGSGAGRHHDWMRQKENKTFTTYYEQLQHMNNVVHKSGNPFYNPSATTHKINYKRGRPAEEDTTTTMKEDWQEEMDLFRTPLPTTFWVNDTDPLAPSIKAYLIHLYEENKKEVEASKDSNATLMLEPIPWYPYPFYAWRIHIEKTAFRKEEKYKTLRHFLIQQTALGTISRQEEVSMIPIFLLNITKGDYCLDMCASPGSKTAQMLCELGRQNIIQTDLHQRSPNELMNIDGYHYVPSTTNQPPNFQFDFENPKSGFVMANEIDHKRANMLIHQVKRLKVLFPFSVFTNHDAQYFPDLPLGTESETTQDNNKNETTLRFNKILCDVVCSGDGTLRKAPHIFNIWSPKEGNNLQKIQIKILLRACHLLKLDANDKSQPNRIVYSTCSLNPIENEAVIYAVMKRTRGAMRLVNIAEEVFQSKTPNHTFLQHMLQNLNWAKGKKTWSVTNNKGDTTYTEPEKNMHQYLFPPKYTNNQNEKDESEWVIDTAELEAKQAAYQQGNPTDPVDYSYLKRLDLSHCMRLFPSHCNGGGFFIAVLEKVKPFELTKNPSRVTSGEGAEEEDDLFNEEEDEKNKNKKKPHPKSAKSEAPTEGEPKVADEEKKTKNTVPPFYFSVPNEVPEYMNHFYFPNAPEMKFPYDQLVMRAAHGESTLRLTPSSTVSFVSKCVLDLLRANSAVQLRNLQQVELEKDNGETNSNSANIKDNLLIVSAGLRAVAFECLEKGWRLCNEGLSLFSHALHAAHSPRLVTLKDTRFIKDVFERGGEKLKDLTFEEVAEDYMGEVYEQGKPVTKPLREVFEQHLSIGTFILCVTLRQNETIYDKETENKKGSAYDYYCAALRARNRVQLLIDHEDVEGVLLRLGVEAKREEKKEEATE